MTNIWHHWPGTDEDVAAIFDPFGNAVHTALAFAVLGEDVLITGAGPIGCMATAVVRHAGARHVVVTDPNPYRREAAARMGATLTVDPRERDLHDVQTELGMTEGFDVALEMSGAEAALHSILDNMSHGGRSRCSASPRRDRDRLHHDRVRHAHGQGDLRPRDVRDLVPDVRHAPDRSLRRPALPGQVEATALKHMLEDVDRRGADVDLLMLLESPTRLDVSVERRDGESKPTRGSRSKALRPLRWSVVSLIVGGGIFEGAPREEKPLVAQRQSIAGQVGLRA